MKFSSYVPRGLMLRCPHCHTTIATVCDIPVSELPLNVSCSFCGKAWEICESWLEQCGKVDASQEVRGSVQLIMVESPKLEDQGAAVKCPSPEQNLNVMDMAVEELRRLSFRKRSEAVADLAYQGLKINRSLELDIETLSQTMVNDLTKSWDIATMGIESFSERDVAEFLKSPFLAVPCNADDSKIDARSRWIIAPRFYKRPMGFPLETFGGYRMELLCPYSQLRYPLDSWMADAVGIPPAPALFVRGRKILGAGLQGCWESIPGIDRDDDHTESHASVRIHNPAVAIPWLAAHGIVAHGCSGVPLSGIARTEHNESHWEKMHGELRYSDPWNLFKRQGRVWVAWQDRLQQEIFAVLAAKILRGTVGILLGLDPSEDQWRESLNLRKERELGMGGRISLGRIYHGSFQLEPFLAMDTLIVHYRSGMDDDFLLKLFRYRGRMIVLGPEDCILDTLEDNELAGIFYGIAGPCVGDPCKMSKRSSCDLSSVGMAFRQTAELLRRGHKSQDFPCYQPQNSASEFTPNQASDSDAQA